MNPRCFLINSTFLVCINVNYFFFHFFFFYLTECGGKNFHFIHKSADVPTVVASSIRSAFEYSGQKCSALGRMYVPESLWPQVCIFSY